MLDEPPLIWLGKCLVTSLQSPPNCVSPFLRIPVVQLCVSQDTVVRVCVSVAQKQCCLSSVKGSQCDSGMISARGGDTCEVDEEKQCTDDSYQVHYCLTIMKSLTAMLFYWSHYKRCSLLDCMQWKGTGNKKKMVWPRLTDMMSWVDVSHSFSAT